MNTKELYQLAKDSTSYDEFKAHIDNKIHGLPETVVSDIEYTLVAQCKYCGGDYNEPCNEITNCLTMPVTEKTCVCAWSDVDTGGNCRKCGGKSMWK